MALCPNCQSDLPAETIVCPDCRQSVMKNSEMSKPVASAPDDSWVAVASIRGARLGEKARSALDASNIPSILMPGSFARISVSFSNAPQAVEKSAHYREKLLMVPRDFKFEARILVRSVLKKDSYDI